VGSVISVPGRRAGLPARREVRRAAARLAREPFTRRAWAEFVYSAVSLPAAIAGFVFTAVTLTFGISVSGSVTGLLVGPPLVAVSTLGVRRIAVFWRGLSRRLLGLRVAEPAPFQPRPGVLGWLRSALTDPVGWRARAYLAVKLPLSVLGFCAAVGARVFALGSVFSPVLPAAAVYHEAQPTPLWLVPFGVVAWFAAPWLTRAVLAADQAAIVRLLGPSLSDRLRDLEQTRAQAVDDSAARLRRIERDLHDGAQAQMVAVAMKLGLAREKLGGAAGATAGADLDRALELVDAAHRGAKEAITELRDLARGIHPPVLDQGLGTALTTLAARSAVPVELVLDLPERPSAAIETIAYFSAAELLANVAKHSGARHATLEAVHVPGLLRVRVSDDGAGGARIDEGTGLAGLAERVRTVDGRLDIASPAGGPTVVTVELPSHA
jgi:signal transduction histidine kinase